MASWKKDGGAWRCLSQVPAVSPQSPELLGVGCAYYCSFSRYLLGPCCVPGSGGLREMHWRVGWNPWGLPMTGGGGQDRC